MTDNNPHHSTQQQHENTGENSGRNGRNSTSPSESTMSKAGQLAMQLAKEKQKLETELSEVQQQYESAKPTTPVGTRDWYVKWLAMTFAVIGVFVLSAGMSTAGQILYVLSGVCWIYVGMQWSDRAIMIGSAITSTSVAMNLVQTFFPS